MKKKIFTLLFLSAAVSATQAQVLFEETFASYTAGSVVETASPISDESGVWTVSCKDGENQGLSPKVYDQTLSYEGYRLSNQGKALYVHVDDQATSDYAKPKHNTICRAITDKVPVDAEKGNVVYTAFLVNFSNNANTSSGYDLFTYFRQGSGYPVAENASSATMRGVVRFRIVSGQVSFYVRKGTTQITDPTWSTEVDKTQTCLLVVKHTCNSTNSSGAADEYALYVNPDPTKPEADNAACKLEAADNSDAGGADLRHICFRQMGSSNYLVGGITVAKSFEEAVTSTANAVNQVSNSEVGVFAQAGSLFVSGAQGEKADVFDLSGKLIASCSGVGSQAIASGLQNGVYMVRLADNATSKTVKVVVR